MPDRNEASAGAREQLVALGGGELLLVRENGQFRENIEAAPDVAVRTGKGQPPDGMRSTMELDDEQ